MASAIMCNERNARPRPLARVRQQRTFPRPSAYIGQVAHLYFGPSQPMPIREILKQTLSALWETKLRSFLTMFGIVWGITSVILLVGLGIGFNVDQKEHLRSIGTDIAI